MQEMDQEVEVEEEVDEEVEEEVEEEVQEVEDPRKDSWCRSAVLLIAANMPRCHIAQNIFPCLSLDTS